MLQKFQTFLQNLINILLPEAKAAALLRTYTPERLFEAIPAAAINRHDLIRAAREPDVHLRAVWQYRHPLARGLIWQLKYNHNRYAARCAGYGIDQILKKMFKKMPNENNGNGSRIDKINEIEKYICVPIPLSKKRRRERGYNQAEWIVNAMQKIDNAYQINTTILSRRIHRDRQTLKNRKERLENAEQIFIVTDADFVCDKKFIIIDDVLTTGSTLMSARSTLIAADAADVICIAVAH